MSLMGIVIIVAFVILITLCIMADRNSNKKFQAKFESEHQAVDVLGDFMITNKGELIYTLPSGSLKGYKVWKLNEIGSIDFADVSLTRREFSVSDPSGAVMKGDYLTPSKKPLKEYAFKSFDVRSGQRCEDIIAFVRKHVGHIKFTVNSVVV